MHRECRERFLRHRGLAIPTCIMARASRTCSDACRDRRLVISFEVGGGKNVWEGESHTTWKKTESYLFFNSLSQYLLILGYGDVFTPVYNQLCSVITSCIWIPKALIFDSFNCIIGEYFALITAEYDFVLGVDKLDTSTDWKERERRQSWGDIFAE